MKKIHIEFSDERLITPSGLVFVGQILGKSSFVKKINRAPISKDYLQKPVTFVSPCHNIASVAPPKPAPIASVIPYADIIDPITIISVFVAYFLNFILSPTKK